MSEYSNLKIIVKLTKYKVFSYDREEKIDKEREGERGLREVLIW